MQVNISVRHGDLSDVTQAKIRSKVEKLDRLFDRLTSVDVTVDLEKADTPRIDLVVSAEHKNDFVATYTSNDLFGCLDQVIHKVEPQIRKYKERIQSHGRSDRPSGEIVGE